jgi:hypothetical protein
MRIKTMENPANFSAGTIAGTAGTEIDAYTYLRGVWNDRLQPTHIRMRAAAIGIEFERPRLAVTATVSDQDFATLLDRRLKRIEEMKGKAIEAPQVEVKPALPGLSDRRYRRF